MQGLIDRIKPKFMSNLHSVGEWILYPQGWQVGTLDADNPIYAALAGTDAHPAIAGFNPGQSADTLYVTNGETTDYADTTAGTVAFTPELSDGDSGGGFVFPDDEALVEAEFQNVLPFHLALARSAIDPDDPVSSVGITVEPFYLDQDEIDPQNGSHSLFDFTFDVSYGDPQEVRVLAKRSLGAVTLNYRINGGTPADGRHERVDRRRALRSRQGHALPRRRRDGDRHRPRRRGRGVVHGWRSDERLVHLQGRVGQQPLPACRRRRGLHAARRRLRPGVTAPQYLSFYTDALTANGIAFDVYDVDANGRTAPDNLGVLSHYDAVLWYTGDDVVTREPGWGPGNASRLAMQEINETRDFMNEGGRVLYTGQRAGQQYTTGLGLQLYDPFENRQCSSAPEVEARCLPLSGSGDNQGDFVEYWLGAAITAAGWRVGPGHRRSIPDHWRGNDPLTGLDLERNGPDSAANQASDSSFIATRGLPLDHRSGGELPAVRERDLGRVRDRRRRPVRPAHRRVVHVVAASPTRATSDWPGPSTCRRAERRCRSGRATTLSSTSTT